MRPDTSGAVGRRAPFDREEPIPCHITTCRHPVSWAATPTRYAPSLHVPCHTRKRAGVSDRQQRIQRRGTRRRAPVDLTDLRSTFDAVTFIYALIDPRDGVVRYVGQAVNPHRRLSGHLSRARTNPTSRAHRWLNELLAAGLRSQLEILQEVVDARSMADRAVMGAARSRLARGSKAAATRASAGGAGHQNVLGRLGRYANEAVLPF
jgi:hypothetical protein